MSLIEVNWNPSSRELRVFALLEMLFFAIVATMVYRRTGSAAWAGGIFSAAVAVGCLGLAVPATIRYLYVAWMAAAFPIGWVVSHLVLAVIFFGLFSAFGGMMRLFGRDPMNRRFERTASTYWKVRTPATSVSRYFRQF
jgi:hypothetical protein